MNPKEYPEGKPDLNELIDGEADAKRFLILHNDDVHSFDYVIESLVEVCEMDMIQAEQCTYLVHYKGKCDVLRGSTENLRPYRDGLVNRGLNATID